MALQEIEHEPFQIVDQILECDQLQLPSVGSFHYHTSVGEGNGKSTTMQYRFAPSFSYRDEESLTPKKHLANLNIELTEKKEEPNTQHEISTSSGNRTVITDGCNNFTAGANPCDNDKLKTVECVANVITRCDYDETIDHAGSLDEKLEESDDDTVPRRLAKHVLRNYKSNMNGPQLSSSGFREPKGFFMTQVMINLHVAVLRDMMKLMPPKHQRVADSVFSGGKSSSPVCKETVMYTCRSLEMHGVSSVSGNQFLKMTLENKIYVVLSIARPFVEAYWNDYDDPIYTECHRQLDIQAKFCVKMLYHNKLKCCIFM